jgi:hypothetical protein
VRNTLATLGSSLLATTLLGSAAIAVAQPAGDMPPPDAGATGGAPAGADAGAPIPFGEPAPPPPVEEPPAKDAKPAIAMTYDKGVVFKTADDEFELKLALRSQMRFESTRSLGDGAQFASSFYLPRTRLQLEGHAFGEDHGYKVEIGLADKGSFSFVKEAYVDWAMGSLVLRTGQYRRPFSRQELTSDFGSEFNERSIANEFAGGGRDLGVMIHNNFEKSPEGLEFAAGIFNGFSGGSDKPKTSIACVTDPVTMEVTCTGGTPSNFPADFAPALVARAAFNHGKIKGYSEIDLEGGPLRASVGLNYKVDLANFDKGAEDSVFANFSHGLGVDAIIKANGLDASIGAYLMKAKSADALFAGYAQGGYLLQPKVHVGARFAFAQEDADVTAIEARAAFSYLLKGHQLKLATDIGILTDTADGTDPDLQIRVMPQLTF